MFPGIPASDNVTRRALGDNELACRRFAVPAVPRLTCPPKPGPGGMLVLGRWRGGQDATEATYRGTDHQQAATGETAKCVEDNNRKVTADFHRWADTQRRYRFRLSALALAVAVPAFFMLGVLLEQQFQIVPLHDPTSGWSAHIWQNYGRTIVDCAEDARRTNKAIECRFPVHAP